MKIAWQSLNSLDDLTVYVDHLQDHLSGVTRPETEVELMGVSEGIGHGVRSFAHFDETDAVKNYIRLRQRPEIDALAIGNGSDPGVRAAREILSIPVTSLLETSLLTAHMLAERFAIITVTEKVASVIRDNVRMYGLEDRVTEVYGPDVSHELLGEALTDSETRRKFVEGFDALVRKSADDGADLVIPAGGLIPILLHRMEGINELHGVPIMDINQVLICMTEAMVDLYDAGAAGTSKAGMYRPPTEEQLAEYEAAYDVGTGQ